MHSKLLIVGAGAAGIAAASLLLENGLTDIVVLEAEYRIGGRINTQHFGESCIDLGAQWCHGEKGNAVFAMADPFNLLASSYQIYMNMSFVDSHGRIVDKNITEWLLKVCLDIVDDSTKPGYEGSVGDFLDKEYYRIIKSPDAEYIIDDELAEQFLQCFHHFQSSIDGADSCFDTSVTSHHEYWECEGNPVLNWKDKGYGLVLDLLTKAFPDPTKRLEVNEKVHFGKQVETINWTCDKDGRVRVVCSDGSEYTADQIMLTISLGVLKEKAETMFVPALSASKLIAISGLSFGTVDKIFIKFSHSWWPKDVSVIGLLWSIEDRNEFLKKHSSNEKRRWLPGVLSFFVDHTQPGLLCGWAVGSVARDMERCSEQEVKEGCQEILDRFLGRTYSVPPIEAILRSTWYSNPHFRGSYSFRSLTTDKLLAKPSQLAQPLCCASGREVVLFAGEATHDHFFSTVHGAIESGWREANRILRIWRDEKVTLIKNPPIITKSLQVVIVGAGMAGLGAAVTLQAAGLTEFIILEAQSRAGGRVKSTFIDGGWLELGAQWIHGEDNALFRIAKDHNLLSDVFSVEGLGPHVYDDGSEIDVSLTAHVAHVISQILEECEDFVQSRTYPKSVGHFLRQRFDQYLDSCTTDTREKRQLKEDLFEWHVSPGISTVLVHCNNPQHDCVKSVFRLSERGRLFLLTDKSSGQTFILRFQKIDNSCTNLHKLSAKDWGKYAFTGGQDCINLSKGYTSLVNVILRSLPQAVLEFGKHVTQIQWMENLDENSPPAVVFCNDGSVYRARHVIITLSLGCLKKTAHKLFKPSLPNHLLSTINALGFGVVDKVCFIYKKTWWSPGTLGFQIIRRTKREMLDLSGQDESASSWLDDLTGFDVLATRPGVLIGWLGGKGASNMENMSKEDIANQCTCLLRNCLKRPDIPMPSDIIRSSWYNNPFVCGGYSHTTTECDELGVGPEDLMKPVFSHTLGNNKHPTILCAGEAAHPTHFSTTHGAFETGQTQAKQILEYMMELKVTKNDSNEPSILSSSETLSRSPVKAITAAVG